MLQNGLHRSCVRVALALAIACLCVLGGCAAAPSPSADRGAEGALFSETFTAPSYSGELVEIVNGDAPDFSDIEGEDETFIRFSPLDSYGRCGAAVGMIGPETIPQGPRSEIQSVTPTGFHNAEYPWIEKRWVYNRCHLIAFILGGGDANAQNLITGTYSFNTQGMLSIEERVLSYINRTGNHVLYRVTPVFNGHELVARGVLMEVQSVEDDGAELSLCRFVHNVEAGVSIDYATGETRADGTISAEASVQAEAPDAQVTFILNASSMRFHDPDCKAIADISDKNRLYFTGTREDAIGLGYRPCGICNP